jgi:NADP-dependent 3-hydroxy acid dehydrogenase YdfG
MELDGVDEQIPFSPPIYLRKKADIIVEIAGTSLASSVHKIPQWDVKQMLERTITSEFLVTSRIRPTNAKNVRICG